MTNPNELTIAAARDALRSGALSAVDLTMACLTAIDAGDALNAFVHKTPDIALTQARAADARLKAGWAPDLCGIPLGIKYNQGKISYPRSNIQSPLCFLQCIIIVFFVLFDIVHNWHF